MSEKPKISLNPDGSPKAEVYGKEIAKWCSIKQIEWMMDAPYGQFKKRQESLLKICKALVKEEKKKIRRPYGG